MSEKEEVKVCVCDGCGKKDLASGGERSIPYQWFSREDKDGRQIACSRECISKIAAKTGKTDIVLPI